MCLSAAAYKFIPLKFSKEETNKMHSIEGNVYAFHGVAQLSLSFFLYMYASHVAHCNSHERKFGLFIPAKHSKSFLFIYRMEAPPDFYFPITSI